MKKGVLFVLSLFSMGYIVGTGIHAGSKAVDFTIKQFDNGVEKLVDRIYKIES